MGSMTLKPHEMLRRARMDRGFKAAAEAARYFGWNVPTYTSHENGIRGISREAAVRYAAAYRLDLSALLGFSVTAANSIEVLGDAALGVWRDKDIDLERNVNAQSPAVPSVGDRGVMRFAVEMKDQSANRVLAAGDFAICEPIDSDALQPNSLLYVERTNEGLAERTVRRLERGQTGMRLVTVSTAAHLSSSIPFPSPGVQVLGRVVGRYSPL